MGSKKERLKRVWEKGEGGKQRGVGERKGVLGRAGKSPAPPRSFSAAGPCLWPAPNSSKQKWGGGRLTWFYLTQDIHLNSQGLIQK